MLCVFHQRLIHGVRCGILDIYKIWQCKKIKKLSAPWRLILSLRKLWILTLKICVWSILHTNNQRHSWAVSIFLAQSGRLRIHRRILLSSTHSVSHVWIRAPGGQSYQRQNRGRNTQTRDAWETASHWRSRPSSMPGHLPICRVFWTGNQRNRAASSELCLCCKAQNLSPTTEADWRTRV